MWYFDTEYNNEQVILLCAVKLETGKEPELAEFDLRDGKNRVELANWIKQNENEIFVSFGLFAEIGSLLRLGIDVSKMKCIDLMAECRMISMSHRTYFCHAGGLVDHLKVFLGLDIAATQAKKDEMRDLIMSKNSWTKEEWDEIVYYCWTDVVLLEDLFKKTEEIHNSIGHHLALSHCLDRGEYVRMGIEMDYASKGFPVYGGNLEKIYGNRPQIRQNIIEMLHPSWKVCYVRNKKGGYTLKKNIVKEVINANGWTQWKVTDNGSPCLQIKYLKELEKVYPSVQHLRRAQQSLGTMNSDADLVKQIKDGYVKPRTRGYSAKTGRNGLEPRQGFLLNLPRWMRQVIHPHPGMALISVDWSQQEQIIAAVLGNDQTMIDAYKTGDLYLELGKIAGEIPPDGTKQTHKKQRDVYKDFQLGLTYGKGIKSLGAALKAQLGVEDAEAQIAAKELFNWHKLSFPDYWNYIERTIVDAKLAGWISTVDNWICCVDKKTARTQLLNWPMQSNGASMMRLATKMFYKEWKNGNIPPVLCSQHDAFYFNCPEPDVEKSLPIILEIMKKSGIILFNTEVFCESEVFTNRNSYTPGGLSEAQTKLWELSTKTKNTL